MSKDGTKSPWYERYEKSKDGTKNPWYETSTVRKVYKWYETSMVRIVYGTKSPAIQTKHREHTATTQTYSQAN